MNFWTEDRLKDLRALLNMLIGRHRPFSFRHAISEINKKVGDRKLQRKQRWLYDLVAGKHRPQDERAVDNVLVWALDAVATHDGLLHLKTNAVYAKALHLDPALGEYRKAGGGVAAQPATVAPRPASQIESLFSTLMPLLGLGESDFNRFNEVLFRDVGANDKRKLQHYHCYRYHSQPGLVVKSYLTLLGPSESVPKITRFACFFKDGALTRESGGLVLPMGKAAYMVGRIGTEGSGLKVIVLPSFGELPISPGLILSMDEQFELIASRCVLAKTDAADHVQGKPGIFSEAKIRGEIEPFKHMLRNTIRFTLQDRIWFKGKVERQEDMVARVHQLLSLRGKPMFTFSDGEPFNPADTKHYTFNGAVTVYHSGGLDERPAARASDDEAPKTKTAARRKAEQRRRTKR